MIDNSPPLFYTFLKSVDNTDSVDNTRAEIAQKISLHNRNACVKLLEDEGDDKSYDDTEDEKDEDDPLAPEQPSLADHVSGVTNRGVEQHQSRGLMIIS